MQYTLCETSTDAVTKHTKGTKLTNMDVHRTLGGTNSPRPSQSCYPRQANQAMIATSRRRGDSVVYTLNDPQDGAVPHVVW
jgi:hypothetical protein